MPSLSILPTVEVQQSWPIAPPLWFTPTTLLLVLLDHVSNVIVQVAAVKLDQVDQYKQEL